MSTENSNYHLYLRNRYNRDVCGAVKKYEKTLNKKAKWDNHHIFSLRCRDEGIIPASLKISPPVMTREGYRIARRASQAFLSARIHQSFSMKQALIVNQ